MSEHQPESPVTPRPSASIVLLRSGGRHASQSLEVLMVKRNDAARFVPGAWVFPGGAVDPGDGDLAGGNSAAGIPAFKACARRELAEEAGVTLPSEIELVLFSRWITPDFMPIRFDAWFFLGAAPPHTEPVPDGSETTDVRWIGPTAALEASRRQEMEISFPTLRKLEQLEQYDSVESALAAHRGRTAEAILPVLVESESGTHLSLPGDPDYPGPGKSSNPACQGPAG